MKAISLGWGVQSFTLAAMSALGDLEPVDVAIHADTTHEASGTYKFASRWTPWLEARGVSVVTVRANRHDILIERSSGTSVPLPAFTRSEPGATILVPLKEYGWGDDGEAYEIDTGEMIEVPVNINGRINRQCTKDWKIRPMRRWLQSNRDGQQIEQWLGISLDEFQRVKDSNVQYITHRWPLIELRMTRDDCQEYLEAHGLEVPPKSACKFCPFHDMAAWREMKANGGEDWQKAVEVDEAIRSVRPPYDLFLHPARIPLVDVDLRSEQDKGQLSLWDAECSGICGV